MFNKKSKFGRVVAFLVCWLVTVVSAYTIFKTEPATKMLAWFLLLTTVIPMFFLILLTIFKIMFRLNFAKKEQREIMSEVQQPNQSYDDIIQSSVCLDRATYQGCQNSIAEEIRRISLSGWPRK